MILHRDLSGYGVACGNISYISIWNKVFAAKGPMKFYPGDYSHIVELGFDSENDVTLYTYPYNDKNKVNVLAEKYIKELEELLQEASKAEEILITVKLEEDGPVRICKDDFRNYYPSSKGKDELFIFDVPESDGGFPSIYHYKNIPGHHAQSLDVLAQSSHTCFLPADSSTAEGKQFFYMMCRSKALGIFSSQVPHDIQNVHFPTRKDAIIPARLNTTELRKLLEGKTANLIKTERGWSYTKGATKSVPEEKEEESDVIDAGDVQDIPPDKTQLIVYNGHEGNIIEDALTKCAVNLSDIIAFGFQQTLRLLGATDIPVDVFLDYGELVRRMCVFAGFFYVIPIDEKDSMSEIFSEDDDLFIKCTKENYPVAG